MRLPAVLVSLAACGSEVALVTGDAGDGRRPALAIAPPARRIPEIVRVRVRVSPCIP